MKAKRSPIAKICTKCELLKQPNEFGSEKRARDGLTSRCKECKNAATRAWNQRTNYSSRWYQANKEKASEQIRQRYAENREYFAEHSRQYHWKNKEKRNEYRRLLHVKNAESEREYNARYREANRERRRQVWREWARNNREKIIENVHRRRARIAEADGDFTAEQWIELCARYEYVCLCCERTGAKLEADHIVPIARGGSNDINNIQPLCRSCNARKHTKIIDYRKAWDESA